MIINNDNNSNNDGNNNSCYYFKRTTNYFNYFNKCPLKSHVCNPVCLSPGVRDALHVLDVSLLQHT